MSEDLDGWWVDARALRRAALRGGLLGAPLVLLALGYGPGPGLSAAASVGALHGLAALVEELAGRRRPGLGRDLSAFLLVWLLAGASVPAGGAQFLWAQTRSVSEAMLGPHMPPLAWLGLAVGGPFGVAAVVRAGERRRSQEAGEPAEWAAGERATWWYVITGLGAGLLAGAVVASRTLLIGPAAPAALGGLLIALGAFAAWMVVSPLLVQLLAGLDAVEAHVFPSRPA